MLVGPFVDERSPGKISSEGTMSTSSVHPPEAAEVLLVEDNPNDLELTLRALRQSKVAVSVRVVRDGAEAMEHLYPAGRGIKRTGKSTLKLIILDLKLPKVDGIELLKKIKSNELTHLIPVVVLTSSREEKDVLQSYQYGASSYVVKPVEFEKFIDTVSSLGIYWTSLNQPPL